VRPELCHVGLASRVAASGPFTGSSQRAKFERDACSAPWPFCTSPTSLPTAGPRNKNSLKGSAPAYRKNSGVRKSAVAYRAGLWQAVIYLGKVTSAAANPTASPRWPRCATQPAGRGKKALASTQILRSCAGRLAMSAAVLQEAAFGHRLSDMRNAFSSRLDSAPPGPWKRGRRFPLPGPCQNRGRSFHS